MAGHSVIESEDEASQGRAWYLFKVRAIKANGTPYRLFWYFTMAVALLNAVLEPYKMAFVEAGGFSPYNDFWTVSQFLSTLIFSVDIILKFFLSYTDPETKAQVIDLKQISLHYLRWGKAWRGTNVRVSQQGRAPMASIQICLVHPIHSCLSVFEHVDLSAPDPAVNSRPPPPASFLFWFDLIFCIPFDGIVLTAAPNLSYQTDLYVGLLCLLKLGRLYRLFDLFDLLDHSMIISQISLMLLRNFVYILLTCHWFACIFYFIARVEDLNSGLGEGTSLEGLASDNTALYSWVSRNEERFIGQPTSNFYIYSLYVSVVFFTGVGDGDFYCATVAESIAMIIYLLFNVVLGAYILGTVTMLMVKGDERSKEFRDQTTSLKEYSHLNDLPPVRRGWIADADNSEPSRLLPLQHWERDSPLHLDLPLPLTFTSPPLPLPNRSWRKPCGSTWTSTLRVSSLQTTRCSPSTLWSSASGCCATSTSTRCINATCSSAASPSSWTRCWPPAAWISSCPMCSWCRWGISWGTCTLSSRARWRWWLPGQVAVLATALPATGGAGGQGWAVTTEWAHL